ncbi:hypothetical protein [Paenibacillus koleovorans]|uniref:hypothetical protein n=1 Tax=Paenibacillus koleovorans TaxID=121608 RepID=UPI000FD9FE8E|nr:hypothetical protein [Paenibacillus koleovorans]
MGVKFNREYEDIVRDLSGALGRFDGVYDSFEMSAEEWGGLEEGERSECLRTLADDLFYALGADPVMYIGAGKAVYDREHHIIKLIVTDKEVQLIYLV